MKNLFKKNQKVEVKAEAQAKADDNIQEVKPEDQAVIHDVFNEAKETIANEITSPETYPCSYEFEFDIVEYPSKLVETIKVIGKGTDEDSCLLNAAEIAKGKCANSQHPRYTQKSFKHIKEGHS